MEEQTGKKDFFKVKVAMFFGYNGLPFHGLQKNPDVMTIEQSLEKALFDSDLIPNYNFGDLKKSRWQRAARTDKGVHAITNVINCKLAIKKKFVEVEEAPKPADQGKLTKGEFKEKVDFSKIVNTLNSNLKDIRVFSIKKVTKNFDCKASARSRLYEYLIPISAFKKPTEKSETSLEFDQKILGKVNTLTQNFLGTRNFHNYSRKMKAKDPKSKRYILEYAAQLIDVQDLLGPEKGAGFKPEEIKDKRYLLFRIKGQSFIYHQIRKMLGILVQCFQLDLPDVYIENSFSNNVARVWLAPAEGLFLNRVCFENYNNKKDIPEKLEFSEEEEKTIEKFRKEVIYPVIMEAELKRKIYTNWLNIVCDPKNNELDESSSEGEADG